MAQQKAPAAKPVKKIEILIDQQRLRENLTVEDYVALEEMQVKGIRAVLALFAVDDKGKYLPEAEAMRLINKLKVGELLDLAPQLIEEAKGASGADPKAPEESSASTDGG